jgi:heterogeneous nuclear ribonucleoprotein R
MSNAKFKLDGNTPTVTWADPKSAPDHSAASQVNLLMSNNTNSLTLKMLKEMLFPCFTSVLHSS